MRSSWLTVERNALLAASASSAAARALLRLLEQPPDLVLLLVELPVGGRRCRARCAVNDARLCITLR